MHRRVRQHLVHFGFGYVPGDRPEVLDEGGEIVRRPVAAVSWHSWFDSMMENAAGFDELGAEHVAFFQSPWVMATIPSASHEPFMETPSMKSHLKNPLKPRALGALALGLALASSRFADIRAATST